MKRALAALALALPTLPAGAEAVPAPIAVTGGQVQGRIDGDGRTRIFEGIPFAAPPLGDLRWRPPAPVVPWQGVRAADAPAPACLQNDYGWNRANHLFASEDCLTLDIRTRASPGDRLPVMVWIHGGSNRAGGSGGTVESRITDAGVVLVSIQYRLGIFGFLARRDLAAEQGGASGNYGLMDQIAALRWVQGNIARFGGDPGNVTIFGESAGSQDVSLLLASPQAHGLFRKAILQSGTPGFGMPFRPLTEALAIGDQLEGSLSELRQSPAASLLAADLGLRDPALWNQDFLWLRTTIDGRVLPRDPRLLLAEAPPRPVIIGTNRYEFGPAPGSIDPAAYARHWFGTEAPAALAFYRAEDEGAPDPRLGPVEGRMETDVVFRCPAGNLAAQLARQGWPVWRYEFDLAAKGAPAGSLTAHAAEIAYVMDRQPPGLQDYWVNFAKTGDPNGRGRPRWGRFARGAYLAISQQGIAMRRNLRPQPCNLVTAI